MTEHRLGKTSAVRFIALLGIVSLFADITYEGARSITGPYLAALGASATAVGLVGGLGELVGYGLRLISGYFTDRTRRYWAIAILGYCINLLAVPLLAIAGRWDVAALLIIAERLGKAIRTPSRDAMLSYAAKQVGTGVGFGLHETLDQIGAVGGPAIVAAALFLSNNRYPTAFAILFIPAILALLVLVISRTLYPRPHTLELEPTKSREEKCGTLGKLPSVFWVYTAFTMVSIAGFANFQLISFHFKVQRLVPDAHIPMFFMAAMAADALVALPIGRAFDRKGLMTLTVLPVLTIVVPFLTLSRDYYLAILGVIIWGCAMGVQETIMRAAIAEIVPPERRGLAYGIFNGGYGIAWFIGSTVMGLLYDISVAYVITFATIAELISIPLLFQVRKAALHHTS